ncbi:SIR2 family NAD-dependent protein deacylase [Curvibacter gracilis]|uniref:SIR2 family NAD-dependent protein deacylase n=1 Tax=Curvibacter gracilis TaxID=230310 RepID=UPI0004B04E9C|nr:Sir2 family NAD-dependent protein deacetylase [Curvibacter gracilis]
MSTLPTEFITPLLRQAAQWIVEADALIITAGAGLGVDSGLPDFRGASGWWRAYPGLRERGIGFQELACPAAFFHEPRLAWGFYGQRLISYRQTPPHAGFELMRQWALAKSKGYFVYTSNVDGQFQNAGFSALHLDECHGSIHHLQCLANCEERIWSAAVFSPQVDLRTHQLTNELPRCSVCGDLARPNILMFNDCGWQEHRHALQARRLEAFLNTMQRPLVLEVGAGERIATVRTWGERVARHHAGRLIRINPEAQYQRPNGLLHLPLGGLEALSGLESHIAQLQGAA